GCLHAFPVLPRRARRRPERYRALRGHRTWSFAKAAFGVPGKRPCWCDRFETSETGTRQWFVRVRRLSALPGGEILEEHGRQAKHVREERVASAGGGEESGVRNQARRLRCPTTSM